MRGKKYSDEIKEQAYLLYATCGNFNEVSRQINVPVTTIKGWIDKKKPDELDELRTKKKTEFVEKASELIDKGLELLDRRLGTALEHEASLDKLIAEIYSTEKEELTQDEKNKLVQKIRALQVQKLGDITTAVGTMYDKRALAQGEATQNSDINIKIEVVK